jgi:hypothetical protein
MPLKLALGRILATPAALEVLDQAGQSPAQFLHRHGSGDWGDVCPDDGRLNDRAVRDGSRVLSAYVTSIGERIWVITEAVDDEGHRAATTILLPDEY